MNYTCLVCGFDDMEEPPVDYAICECCGTEFGYHDLRLSHAQLRQRWITGGALWWSIDFPPPPNWSPLLQLQRSGHKLTQDDVRLLSGGPANPTIFISKIKATAWVVAGTNGNAATGRAAPMSGLQQKPPTYYTAY